MVDGRVSSLTTARTTFLDVAPCPPTSMVMQFTILWVGQGVRTEGLRATRQTLRIEVPKISKCATNSPLVCVFVGLFKGCTHDKAARHLWLLAPCARRLIGCAGLGAAVGMCPYLMCLQALGAQHL